jgi:hypothetical protein
MTSEVADEAGAGADEGQKVKFHYIKSPYYRTVHVDGVIGGVTPHSTLALGIYSERLVYPDQMVYGVSPQGDLGNELKEERISREGIGRELEASLVMSITTARELARWLIRNIRSAENAIKELQAKKAGIQEGGEQ